MPIKYEMCTTCGLTKSPIATYTYVIRSTAPAQVFRRHVNLQCTPDQVKPITMCVTCFNEMAPLPAPTPTNT